MDAEMRAHVEMQTQENLEAGMAPDEARRAALRQFGWVESIKETCREQRGVSWLEDLVQDVRFGLRMLRKSPGFSVVAIVTLALGIGANTAMFSVVNALLVRPLPYPEPNRIVQVWSQTQSNPRVRPSKPDFKDLKEQSRSFAKLALYRRADFHFTSTSEPQEVRTGRVSSDFFDVLGVPALWGRTFRPNEATPGQDQVVILSYGVWLTRFAGDTNVIGRPIGLEGKSCVVCGVMPPKFDFPDRSEVWVPYGSESEFRYLKRDDHFDFVIGRLAEGATLSGAQAELRSVAARLEQAYPGTNKGLSAGLIPLSEELVWTFKPALFLLLGAVGAVLLVACANIANLQLARGVSREKEIAMRSALGAKRGRVIRQLLAESILLSGLGGAGGLVVAHFACGFLLAVAPGDIPRLQETRLDGIVLVVCLAASVLAGVLFGLVPAVKASRANLVESLKDGGQGVTDGSRRNGFRNGLVVGELATAVVLLIGAALLLQSLHKLGQVPLGFNPRDLATTRITLPWWKYHAKGKDKPFLRALYDRIRSMPGVRDVAMVAALPIVDRQTQVWLKLVGDAVEPGREWIGGFNYITPSYFETMGIPLLRGRKLDDHDDANSQRALVIDDSLARRYFRDQDPIGKEVLIEGQGEAPFSIVGIVGGVRQRNPAQPPAPQLYMQYQQINEGSMWLVARHASNLPGLEKAVAREVQALDVDQSIGPVRTMEEYLGESSRLPRFRTFVLGLLALLAATLATAGTYSVTAYFVSQRNREMGLRMALGAGRRDILKLVLRQNGRPAALGALLGVALAFGTTRVLENTLFEVSPRDPATLIVIPAALTVVALLGCYLPARRAARVDPIVALRDT